MFENDDVEKANRVPALVWAIIAGLVTFGILANVVKSGGAVIVGGVVVAVVVFIWRK